jgi:hypothetical protein
MMKWIASGVFIFRLVGQTEWIECKQSWKNPCGFAAWECNTAVRYECLTNVERPPIPTPRPLTKEELDSIRENSERVMP